MELDKGNTAEWTVIPAVRDTCCELAEAMWTIRCIEDLAPAIMDPSGHQLTAAAQAVLEPLILLAHPKPWRTTIDVEGLVLSCAVDHKRCLMALGSPRFASEALIVGSCREHSASHNSHCLARLADLDALVEMHARASRDDAPSDLELVYLLHGSAVVSPDGHAVGLADPDLLREVERLAVQVDEGVSAYSPSLREHFSQWGLELTSQYTALRLHLLRFVAALPSLDHDKDGAEVVRLLREAIRRLQQDDAQAGPENGQLPLPTALRMAVAMAHKVAWALPYRALARWTRLAVRTLARTFIAGENVAEAAKGLAKLRKSGRDATLDQLGELVVSEREADIYRDRVLELIVASGQPGQAPQRNAAGIERGHVSIKVSALCSDYDGDDPDGTWRRVGPRLQILCLEAHKRGVFVNFDAEHYHVRDLTLEMFRRVLATPALATWTGAGIVVQAYLRDAADHLEEVLALCRQRGVRTPIRLVKGAYWDAETIEGAANDFPAPQLLNKPETDALYQLLCLKILQAGPVTQLCVGSHNLRDHCFAHAARDLYFRASPAVEHQTLHMTYEGLSTAMAKLGWAVRNYIPVGSLLVGMAYLVRRILENSSQVGVLTLARHGAPLQELLEPPLLQLERWRGDRELERDPQREAATVKRPAEFYNVAPLRLYRPAQRQALEQALAESAQPWDSGVQAGRQGPMVEVYAPAHPRQLVGKIDSTTPENLETALALAAATAQSWGETHPCIRTSLLVRAAEVMRRQRPSWAALIVRESGKSRSEALGDVDEAIDFLQFYAREALRLARELPQARARGPIAVVCPWNFPLAIPVGMASGALVMGNPVLLKSAEQTPLVVERWVQLMHSLGTPLGALQHLVGDGPGVGAPLTADPRVHGVLFTGSRAVGTRLHRALAGRACGSHNALAITEMGGKNAIVVTANADLDEAVSASLRSAFAHAGQKCSAASRVLIDQRIAAPFLARFCEAARDLQVGPSETPGTRINPVITLEDRDRLRNATAQLRSEADLHGGKVHVDRSAPGGGSEEGHLVGPVVVELTLQRAMAADSWAQQELFGPVVHVIPYASAEQAVAAWTAPEYALTGGIFAQSQDDIDDLIAAARVGNLYVNRTITGARVGIEPFGGFQMSGTGPKAGGRDYLTALITLPIEACPPIDPGAAFLRSIGEVRQGPPGSAADGAEAEAEHQGHAAGNLPSHHGQLQEGPPPFDADLSAGIALASTWQAAGEAWPSLTSRCQVDVTALVHWAVRHLPNLASGTELNRVIPGQNSYNRWALAKGLTVVVAGSRSATRHAVLHAMAAAMCGNPVQVLACGPAAAKVWGTLVDGVEHGGRMVVTDITSLQALLLQLANPAIASVVLDGRASEWAPLLDAMVQTPPGARHLRALHCPGAWPPPNRPDALVRAHLHVTSLAVNTMRHGAPLEVTAAGRL